MRDELPNLRGAFKDFGWPDNPERASFDQSFVIVMAFLALGVAVCIAGIVFT
jgi:hypothetical protein